MQQYDNLTNISLNERNPTKQLTNCMISFILNTKAGRSMLLQVRIVFPLRVGVVSGRKRKSGFWVTGKVLFFYFGVGDMAVFSL